MSIGEVIQPYVPRIVDVQLDELLPAFPAVAIEGAKGVGKTVTARRRARTVHALDARGQSSCSAPTLADSSREIARFSSTSGSAFPPVGTSLVEPSMTNLLPAASSRPVRLPPSPVTPTPGPVASSGSECAR